MRVFVRVCLSMCGLHFAVAHCLSMSVAILEELLVSAVFALPCLVLSCLE